MKKLTSLILIVLLIGLFMISCTGGETSDLPAHLRDYFSSDALMMMPDDTVITMKIDSLNDVYKALEFGYLNDAMTEEQLQKLVNKFDINPLQTANIEDMYGIDPDKPIIIAVKEINATGPFNPENILFMMAFPFTDENKLLTEVFEIDLEEYTIEEVGGGSIYVKDLGPNTGVMRDGYFIALGSPEASKEDIKSIAETMLTLPEDQTLRNSERYIQHMSNSNPESIFNFYMDIAAVDIDPEEIMELMGNYGNPGPFNAFGSMANFDQIEELEYALMDGYVSDKTMGMSLYTESVEGSDIFSGSYPMSDIFKNIPGEIALFSYQNSDMSNISEEMVQDITNNIDMIFGELFSSLEQETGKSIYEIVMLMNGEFGLFITDFQGPLMLKAGFSIGLADTEGMNNILPSIANYISSTLDININESDGIYSTQNIGVPYSINFGIAKDSLIFASSKQFFNDIINSNEKTSDEITNDKIKNSFSSDKASSISHINVTNIIEGLLGLVQNDLELSNLLTQLNELLVEINSVSFMYGDYATNEIEMIFSQTDFLPKLYDLLIEIMFTDL